MPETTIVTLFPLDKTEKPRRLTVPATDAYHWAVRAMMLFPGKLAYVQFVGPGVRAPYLGQMVCSDNDLAFVKLWEWRVIQFTPVGATAA